jgi:hypothetical protein
MMKPSQFAFGAILAFVCFAPMAAQPGGPQTPIVGRATVDTDGDGLPDEWEAQFSLSPTSTAGADGAMGDPDGDGRTNLQEFEAGTHPRGFVTRYLAEGATNAFFDTTLALLNPGATAASVLLRFLKSDGATESYHLPVPAGSRRTFRPATIAGLATASFSSVIESDALLVVDRTMTWDGSHYGSHAEAALLSPSMTWYLAEGATHSGFDLFYLLQNSNSEAARVEVRYLLPGGAPPLTKTYDVAPNSRFTIWVDLEGPELASTDVSAQITADRPIIVERAMYLNSGGQVFGAGHESAGITAPATSWFLAEGATGAYFDLFVLIANPNGVPAEINATYLLPSGRTLTKAYTIPPNSRFNIWVDEEQFPDGSGERLLADTAISTTIASTNGVPIIVERTMWWPGTAATWQEAHNSPGATTTGTKWALAEGEVGGAVQSETYILIANTSATAGAAKVTLLFEDGTAPAERVVPLAANSRTNVAVAADFPEAAGKRFGAIVESVGDTPAQVVVERAMYSNAAGVVWAAGTNALATALSAVSGTDVAAAASGTVVTLFGSGFSPQSRVTVGGLQAPVTFVSSHELRLTVPFAATADAPAALAAGTALIRVDDAVLPFEIIDLPPNPYAPGALLQHVVTTQLAAWDEMKTRIPAALDRAQAGAPSAGAVELLAATFAAVPAVDRLLHESLTDLASSLDADRLALLERTLLARGFTLPAVVPAAGARSARAAIGGRSMALGTSEGDAFLAQRAPEVQAGNTIALVSTAVGLVALECPKCTVVKLAAFAANVASIVGDVYLAAAHGTVTRLMVAAADDPITPSGTTLTADIEVKREVSAGTGIAAAFQLLPFIPTRDTVDKVVEYFVQFVSILDRYYRTIPGRVVSFGDTRTLPVSFSLIEPPIPLYLNISSSGHVDLSPNANCDDSEDIAFRLQRNLLTDSERRDVVANQVFRFLAPRGRFFTFSKPLTLTFTVQQGARTVNPQLFTIITNTEVCETKMWRATASQPWIQVASTGTFQPNGSALGGTDVVVSVDPSSLPVGQHRGTITVTADVDGSPQTVDIAVIVRPLQPSLSGTWKGLYRYGAECANYLGEETLSLTDDAGAITGTLVDRVISPTTGVFTGRVQGTFVDGQLSLSYTYDNGAAAALKATANGNTIDGTITGVCGSGARVTFTK